MFFVFYIKLILLGLCIDFLIELRKRFMGGEHIKGKKFFYISLLVFRQISFLLAEISDISLNEQSSKMSGLVCKFPIVLKSRWEVNL